MNFIMLYTIAIIILVWVLVILTSRVISDRKERSVISIRKLNVIYVFILFFMIVFMLLIMMEFYHGPTITLTNKDNYQITVKEKIETESVESAYSKDTNLIYVDNNNAFYFTLPVNSAWSKPKNMNGLLAYMEKTGLETNKANAELFLRWNPYTELLQCVFSDLKMNPYEQMLACLDNTIRESPYGNMMRLSYSTQIEYGKPIEIRITGLNDKPFSIFNQKDSISGIHPASGETNLNFINYFNITVFDKTQIPKSDNRFTLANYFLQNTVNLASNAEKIIASEDNILLAFSFKLENALLSFPALYSHSSGAQAGKDKGMDIRIHRWGRLIEDSERLYILEMAYSPETDDERSSIWNDLKTTFESFTVLAP